MSQEISKKAVGIAAANLIQDGMLIGIGTGTTVFYFIQRLIERCREGLRIQAIPSSEKSLSLAQQGGIQIADIEQITSVDITVDGADEIDPLKRMIKGGGGALIREKILASMSREMIVIVDEAKLVSALGTCKLPVEVIPFAHHATMHKIEKLGYRGHLRKNPNRTLYVTDNGNLIFDIHFDTKREHPEEDHEALIHIPGVVDTGFFFNLAGRVIVGFSDGQVVIRD